MKQRKFNIWGITCRGNILNLLFVDFIVTLAYSFFPLLIVTLLFMQIGEWWYDVPWEFTSSGQRYTAQKKTSSVAQLEGFEDLPEELQRKLVKAEAGYD